MGISQLIDGLDEILAKVPTEFWETPLKEKYWGELFCGWHGFETIRSRPNRLLTFAAIYGLQGYFDIKRGALDREQLL
jgi:hypothetical protein